MTPHDSSGHVEPVGDADNSAETVRGGRDKALAFACTDDGHWVWSGRMLRNHPVVLEDGRYIHACRTLWRRRYSDLPKRARLRRLCDVTACVRPEHYTLASANNTIQRYGRELEEVRALEALLKYKATQLGGSLLSWEPSAWALDPGVVSDLAVATGSPLWVVHAAYSRLAQRALRKAGAGSRADAKMDSKQCADQARRLLGKDNDRPSQGGGPSWLPK